MQKYIGKATRAVDVCTHEKPVRRYERRLILSPEHGRTQSYFVGLQPRKNLTLYCGFFVSRHSTIPLYFLKENQTRSKRSSKVIGFSTRGSKSSASDPNFDHFCTFSSLHSDFPLHRYSHILISGEFWTRDMEYVSIGFRTSVQTHVSYVSDFL